ncbi:3-dehydroquinate synthase [Metabacillus litoralis]|uniref:3-dehydroquinate synthase n=1 Tax=Metabacillus litoralis TaxID=152268 RepID=A0A5C6W9W3_9BACI|nr:3-dehydroquinate synthase [Metabacillus litoralis]TXC93288.1 3-dehydroquinate synthase [Metabacillus litoralis]
MKSILVKTTDSIYPVYVGDNAIKELSPLLLELNPSKVLIVTDNNVDERYGSDLVKIVSKQFPTCKFVVKNGESSKSFELFYELQSFALKQGLDRKSVILAFGGGVVGDLTGFVAATFMRGVPYIQIPTTLLAHDSAVGGKVAINHPEGKNMIGAFYQPKAVVYDSKFLNSLPDEELRSGFAEVIKHSLIRSEPFYHFLYNDVSDLRDLSSEKLETMILEGIKIKADVVSHDERELGLREILNFGHTLGHAIEAEAGYGRMSHGDCVAIGMLFAIWLSNKFQVNKLPYEEIKIWFEKIGFPTSIPAEQSTEELVNKMTKDKKTKSNQIKMILLQEIGVTTSDTFTKDELHSLLEEWRGLERGEKI